VAAVLDGLRVLSLCTGAVMPELTRLLAEFGADVIKIESASMPDFMRRVTPNYERSPGWSDANRNKRSFAVNLKSEEGRQIVRRLAATVDVMGENFRGDVVDSWGLGYAKIREANPRIIYISSQGFGRGGPDEHNPTFGPNLVASFGLQSLWSHPSERIGVGATINHPDHLAGKVGLVAVMAALEQRRLTGEGQFIDLSQAETGAVLMGEAYLEWSYNRRERRPRGNRNPAAAPQGAYPCAGEDRWCVLTVETDEEWKRLTDVIGRPEAGADPRLSTLQGRIEHHDEIDQMIAAWTSSRSPSDAVHTLQRAGIAAGWVQTAKDHLEDPHLAARQSYVQIEHPVSGSQSYLTNQVARLSATPVLPARHAPLLGEHTDEICRDVLGLDAATITDLRERKIVGF
jgi:benzylsuccinate CoA-transferase BbsF subunit